MKIERVRVGQVQVGEFICEEDEEGLDSQAINAGWDPQSQDWQVVCGRRGHADVGQLLLQMHNGERYWAASQSWEQWCWRLVDDEGEPVVDEGVVA